jgi:hypothetical protein
LQPIDPFALAVAASDAKSFDEIQKSDKKTAKLLSLWLSLRPGARLSAHKIFVGAFDYRGITMIA